MRTLVLCRLTASFLFLMVPTEAISQTVRVRWDRDAENKEYKTYAWLDGTRVEDDRTHRIIVEYVDGQLGVNSVFKDESDPDLHVVYHASSKHAFEITGGYGRNWKGADAITVGSHIAGTLVIDLVDAAENRVVWRGIATATVTDDYKKNRDKVVKAVERMFADFPPGTR